jgi:RNA polymerase sigma-70 factor (ECF subfamily)
LAVTESARPGHVDGESMNGAAHDLALPGEATGATPGTSFDELYGQHFDFVWRSLFRLGVPSALVEDATQDTFVVVHRRLSTLQPEASARAWLFGIALRVAHDYRRSQRRKPTRSFEVESTASPDAGPFERTAAAEASRVLDRFLDSLDDAKRAVFVMAEMEEMTAPEISEALGATLNTVYSRLRVARERFVLFLSQGAKSNG